MSTFPGLKKLNKLIESIKDAADEMREKVSAADDRWNNRSEAYQESDKGQELRSLLDEISSQLDNIDQLDEIGTID